MRTLVCLAAAPALGAVNYSRLLNPGSSGVTTISAMTADAAGNVYLTGSTTSASFPVTAGALQTTFNPGTCSFVFDPHSPPVPTPCSDAFVVKLDAGGNVAFATYLGGSGADAGQAIAVDGQGAIYIAGTTFHETGSGLTNDFPTTPGAAFHNQAVLSRDAFVARLNASGTALVYSTIIPGAGHATPLGLAVDGNGNAVFGGVVLPSEGLFPVSAGAFQTVAEQAHFHGGIAKLNAAGSALTFSTFLGGSNDDYVAGIALDSAGNVYAVGTTYSADFPVTGGAYRMTKPNAVSGAFVTRLNPAGSALIYSTYVGGSGSGGDSATAIRVDSQGNALVLGMTSSQDFPISNGAFETASAPHPWSSAIAASYRPFVLDLNAAGNGLIYSTLFEGAVALDADAAGNAYVAAQAGYGFPVTPGAAQRCNAGAMDAVVAQLDRRGALAAASYVGGSADEAPAAVAVSANGAVFVAGSTISSDFPGAQAAGARQTFITALKIADPKQTDLPCMALVAQNAASFMEGPVAAGEIVALRGLGFGPEQGTQTALSLPAQSIPAQLAGVRVLFDGIAAPLLYVQSQQINAQVPLELAGKTSTQVHVEYLGASSNTDTLTLASAAPGLFMSDYSTQQAAAVNQDGTLNSPANPAKRGSFISLYGTGGGVTNPPGVTGGFTPLGPLEFLAQPPTVQLGSLDTEVQYAGAAPTLSSGLFQINIRIPSDLPATLSNWVVTVKIGGVSSPASGVTIAVSSTARE